MTTIKISSALNERDFWLNCIRDFENAVGQVIIQSTYLSPIRLESIEHSFRELVARNVTVCVFLQEPRKRDQPALHSPDLSHLNYGSFEYCVERLKSWGVHVTLRKKARQKFVVIDRFIHYAGGINPLSYCDAEEHMRRFEGSRETPSIIEKHGLLDCERCKSNTEKYVCRDELSLGRIINRRRKELGRKKSDLSRATGIYREEITSLEKFGDGTVENMFKLAEALDLLVLEVPEHLAAALCEHLTTLDLAENDRIPNPELSPGTGMHVLTQI